MYIMNLNSCYYVCISVQCIYVVYMCAYVLYAMKVSRYRDIHVFHKSLYYHERLVMNTGCVLLLKTSMYRLGPAEYRRALFFEGHKFRRFSGLPRNLFQ